MELINSKRPRLDYQNIFEGGICQIYIVGEPDVLLGTPIAILPHGLFYSLESSAHVITFSPWHMIESINYDVIFNKDTVDVDF